MAVNNKNTRRQKGKGYIFRKNKSKYYYLRYNVCGKIKEISLNPATTIAAAESEAKKYIPNIQAKTKEDISYHIAQARNLITKQNEVDLKDVWDIYLNSPQRKANDDTAGKNKSKFTGFLNWLSIHYPHITTVRQLTDNEADNYAKDLWKSGITGKTYNDHIEIICMVLRIAGKLENSINPFRKENIPKKHAEHITRKEFTENEVLKILKSFDDDYYVYNKEELRVLLNIAAWTAQRLKDCCLLKWESVNRQTHCISLIPSKTRRFKKQVNIPIHPELGKWLEYAEKWRCNEYVMPIMAKRYINNPRGITSDIEKVLIYNGFDTIKKTTGGEQRIKGANLYGIHSFRHSFVTFCLRAGVPMAVVESIIGDGSPVIKKHYLHVGSRAVEQAYNALPGGGNNLNRKQKLIRKIENATEEKLKKIEEILG